MMTWSHRNVIHGYRLFLFSNVIAAKLRSHQALQQTNSGRVRDQPGLKAASSVQERDKILLLLVSCPLSTFCRYRKRAWI